MVRERETLRQLINRLDSYDSRTSAGEIVQIRKGVYRIGELRVTVHNCPKCLRKDVLSEGYCEDCDWFIQQDCPLYNNREDRKQIRQQFSYICEEEYQAWLERQLIQGVARKFLSTSPRPRHFAVIAYEIRQEFPDLNIENLKVLHALRESPEEFVELKSGEFELTNSY